MAPAPILTVPAVLGMTFSEGEKVASAAGFTLASLEEDTGDTITVQLPAADAEVEKGWTRILVWFTDPGADDADEDPSDGLIASE